MRARAVGLELALPRCQLPIIVESDCLQLISSTKGKVQDRSHLAYLISELRPLFSHERVYDVVKVCS
jgi:hypothetical protein